MIFYSQSPYFERFSGWIWPQRTIMCSRHFVSSLETTRSIALGTSQAWVQRLCKRTWNVTETKIVDFSHKAPKYENKNLFRCKFLSMFRVFHLAWSTCHATKLFVAGWRKLLGKVECGSTLSNKFWLCCSFFIKVTTCHATNLLVPWKINQSARRISSTRNDKLITPGEKRETSTKIATKQCCASARQVKGFCISYFAVFMLARDKTSYRYTVQPWEPERLLLYMPIGLLQQLVTWPIISKLLAAFQNCKEHVLNSQDTNFQTNAV